MMEQVSGLAAGQLVILAGIGLVLLLVLVVLKFVFKMSSTLLKLSCLGIVVILLSACVVLWALPR